MGAWRMGARDGDHLGDVQFGAKTSEYFRQNIQFPFFEHYLKGKGAAQPKAVVFETGTNVWRHFDPNWPPKAAQAKMLYFHAGGKLSFDAPTAKCRAGTSTRAIRIIRCRSWVTRRIRFRSATWWTISDSRATRPDVLIYASDPLEEDVTIAGPISPKLKVATSSTDSDFDVKLIDVYPNDYPNPAADAAEKRILDAPPLHDGRVSAIAARRAVPREVPQQLGEAGAAGAGEDDGDQLHHAGSVPYVPQGTPHHGAGAEFLVSADRSQPADVCRHSERETRRLPQGDGKGISWKGKRVGG